MANVGAWVWDNTNKVWRKLAVDANGKIKVATS